MFVEKVGYIPAVDEYFTANNMNPIADTKASKYSSNTMTEHLKALETFIDKDTLASFNVNAEHENWPGPIADTSLFNIWKRMQARCNASDSLIVFKKIPFLQIWNCLVR